MVSLDDGFGEPKGNIWLQRGYASGVKHPLSILKLFQTRMVRHRPAEINLVTTDRQNKKLPLVERQFFIDMIILIVCSRINAAPTTKVSVPHRYHLTHLPLACTRRHCCFAGLTGISYVAERTVHYLSYNYLTLKPAMFV